MFRHVIYILRILAKTSKNKYIFIENETTILCAFAIALKQLDLRTELC